MEYKSQNVICQNCHGEFTIEPEDFNFYQKIKVPPPTFCTWCRFIRRMSWRNDRALYKRTCDLCKKNIIAMYSPNSSFPVYCRGCWFGDNWDPVSFGKDFDFFRPFFEQYKELSNIVPRLALWQRNVINSDYSNMTGESKNVYLSVSVVKNCENVFYSKAVDNSRDIVDCLNIINGSEKLYETIEAQGNYNSQYLLLCRNTLDSYYSIDCINCSNCFLCYNLRNKNFCIRNQQYSEEDYLKELKKFNLKSRSSREKLLIEFEKIKKEAIFRFGNINKAVNSTGNNLLNVKNCKNCYEIYNMEDCKNCFRAFDSKDCMDTDYCGWSELMYEYTTGAKDDYNVRFSYSALDGVRNAEYTEFCKTCNNIFGCISFKNGENAILNKIYSKEEFQKLRLQIIAQMNAKPFMDKKGRIYKYGEFFPTKISPWAYNETPAQEFAPITKSEATEKGFPWKEQKAKDFDITIPTEKIPNNIDEVNENIMQKILGCAHRENCQHLCTSAFRITDYELKFYKKHNIPLPDLCPNCRYHRRFSMMPDNKLYHRSCICEKSGHGHVGKCTNEFETSYAPDRLEKVYCENCYNKEIY